ncbi:MAG TPA: alpha-E domain-containing protein [Chloroflexota bacterium]|nr:alpha-E domain-containing protein [Chloroflexota bacterium]
MLSRVAENILWMSRYVERAENTARIIDVNFRLLLDSGAIVDHAAAWEPLVSLVPQTRVLFDTLYPAVTASNVCRFMTFDNKNPNSIVSTVAYARECARGIRESLSSEMWEQLNTLYLRVTGPEAATAWAASPHAFYRQVQYGSQHFQGTTDATMPHDEGWHFMQVGKYLERADNATRILDSKHQLLGTGAGTVEAVQLFAVLKSCSAYEAFRRHQVGALVTPREVVQFLLLDPYFPRSVLFCIHAAWSALRAIGGAHTRAVSNAVERALGLLQAQLEYAELEEVLADLQGYVDALQRHINRVGEHLQRVYLYSLVHPVVTTAEGRVAQVMAEQQQQARRAC